MMEERMLLKRLALPLLGTALLAAPAQAQTNEPAPPMPKPSAGDSAFGAQEPVRMGWINFMTEVQPGHWRASKLRGLNVYNQNNEKIGDIRELIADNSGRIQAVVVGVGGFLGMGEHDVAIPFDQVKFVNEPLANTANPAITAESAPGGAATTGSLAGSTYSGAGTNSGTAPSPNAANPNASAVRGTVTVGDPNVAAGATQSFPDHATLNMTRDQLKAAPEFK